MGCGKLGKGDGGKRGGRGRGRGRERMLTASVSRHSRCAEVVVLGEAGAFDALLGQDIAGCKKDLYNAFLLVSPFVLPS